LNPFLDNAGNGVKVSKEICGTNAVQTLPGTVITIHPVCRFSILRHVMPQGNGCGTSFSRILRQPNFRTPYSYNYNLNIEKSLAVRCSCRSVSVGSAFASPADYGGINQPALDIYRHGDSRPSSIFAQFRFGVINEIETNALQLQLAATVLKVRDWHRFTGQFTYTWATALRHEAYRGTLPRTASI